VTAATLFRTGHTFVDVWVFRSSLLPAPIIRAHAHLRDKRQRLVQVFDTQVIDLPNALAQRVTLLAKPEQTQQWQVSPRGTKLFYDVQLTLANGEVTGTSPPECITVYQGCTHD
jgi:hypothetical protein